MNKVSSLAFAFVFSFFTANIASAHIDSLIVDGQLASTIATSFSHGQSFKIGDTVKISWSIHILHNDGAFDISTSQDGKIWTKIADALVDTTRSHKWVAAGPVNTSLKIRVHQSHAADAGAGPMNKPNDYNLVTMAYTLLPKSNPTAILPNGDKQNPKNMELKNSLLNTSSAKPFWAKLMIFKNSQFNLNGKMQDF